MQTTQTTLVTGATGMVGHNIVKSLLQKERKIRVLVRSIPRAKKLLPEQCEFTEGDITDPTSIHRAMEDCDIIYHAAGFPEQWKKDPTIFQHVNVGGTRNMAEAALQHNVKRFIYTSTIDVFRGEAGQNYDESVIDPEPKGTYYERSKQDADRYVTAALQKGLPAIFLHPSGVYGPGPNVANAPGLNDIITKLQKNEIPVLLPGGFPLVYAPDVGAGHVLAEEKARIGERYILSESYHNLHDVVETVLRALELPKKPPPTMPLSVAKMLAVGGEWLAGLINKPPLIAKGQLHFLQWQAFPQNEKAKRELGWKATPYEEGLRETIQFLTGFS